ncbi:MAG: (2Fe-2S)-binding protein [Proteobacteria bacterium]|nr:(2Fe-2S)-binding protein [Pseudomonadota bacterium]
MTDTARAADADRRPLCYCFEITADMVRAFFDDHEATIESLIETTGVGTRCTACMLDLDVVLESVHRNAPGTAGAAHGRGVATRGRGLRQPLDLADSIYFVCYGTVSTSAHIGNYPILFDRDAEAGPFAYSLFLLAEDGSIAARRRGRVAAREAIEIDFAAIPNCPPRGWCLLSLYPRQLGFRGSIRPYITLVGPDWSAALHMQRHAMASRRGVRNTMFLPRDDSGRFDATVSVINSGLRATPVRLLLTDPYSDFATEQQVHLPLRGSTMIDLDTMFPEAPENGFLKLSVFSNEPTRKHIINRHVDGSWSIDHFPDMPN